MTRTEHVIRADGAELVANAQGAGPEIVLLHAGVADRRAWFDLMDLLSDDHRLIAYDQRGYGQTMFRTGVHDPREDLAVVLDSLATGPVGIVGNSIGGRLAIDIALWRPELVRGLVLIGSAVRGAPAPEQVPEAVTTLDARIDQALENGDIDEANRLEAHMWLDGPLVSEGRVTGEVRELFSSMNRMALDAPDVGPEGEIPDAWDRLEDIRVPTLVISGTHDVPHIQERQTVIADRIPDARLEVMEGVAHLPALEAPERVAQMIEEFLG